MAGTRAALRVVHPDPDVVEVPVELLGAAIDTVATVADDLLSGIEAAERRVWDGHRGAALNELGRMHVRVEDLADRFIALEPFTGQRRTGA